MQYRKLKQTRKLFALYDAAPPESIAPWVSLTPVVRSLLKLSRTDLALELLQRHMSVHGSATPTRSICIVFLSLCRQGALEDAAALLRTLDIIWPAHGSHTLGAPVGGNEDATSLLEAKLAANPLLAEDDEGREAAAPVDLRLERVDKVGEEGFKGGVAGSGTARRDEAQAVGQVVEEMLPEGMLKDGVGRESAEQATVAQETDGLDTAEVETVQAAVHSTLLPALALAHLAIGDSEGARALVERVTVNQCAAFPPLERMTQLLREFGKAKSLTGIYACLDVMAAARHVPNADSLQVLVDALVKDCRFVTGGVSMQTLPQAPIPEVAFIGRSNVGKSSLVNMLLGRRAIAYTSKTPGKTQQYNYFLLNEGRRQGEVHVVDMPGLGFAKVASDQRRKWLEFVREYVASRAQLRLFVHLIDGEVGPQDTDYDIMQMVGGAAQLEGCAWEYAIILTKVDKIGARANPRVEAAVLQAVQRYGCDLGDRLIRTSARTKFGRDDAWRLLRPVMLPDGIASQERAAAVVEELTA